MYGNLLSGIRDLRTGVVTGSMILLMIYLFWSYYSDSCIIIPPSINNVINLFGKNGIIIALVILAYLVGVSYISSIETLVNKIHRWTVFNDNVRPNLFIRIIQPLSSNSKSRLNETISQFIGKHLDINTVSDLLKLEKKIINDILWMEGKLTGSKLDDKFFRMNSEAQFRLGVGILLPLFVTSIFLELSLSNIEHYLIIAITVFFTVNLILQGFYLHRKSLSLLAHYVADGELSTPTMESITKSTDRNT